MTERIQKILSSRGLCSRRQAENWILDGRVYCNGKPCSLGQCADPDVDVILVDGKEIPAQQDYIYLMLHKPKGCVTTLSDERGRKNASQLVEECGVRVYPVGRLDMDSEGLLLFTNDGDFAHKLTHPKHCVNKVYRVWVKNFSQESVVRLQKPMTLDGYRLSVPEVKICSVKDGILEITIHEGRNRQVRRMCAIANMPVKRLVRIAEGPLVLGNLPVGKWRHLTENERKAINSIAD